MRTIAVLFLIVCTADGSDWTRWRGPEGTGISSESDWKPAAVSSPKVLWKASVGAGHSATAVAGNRLYTMGNRGGSDVIVCLDAETGKEVWKHTYRCSPGDYSGPRAMPVLDGGLVYTLSQEGHALCLDAADGSVKWQKHLIRDFGASRITWGFAGSPLIVGDTVVYNARAHGLALDKTTGRRVWASGAGAGGYATPVQFEHKGKECLAIFGAKAVYVVDAAEGKRLYAYSWKTAYDVHAADPIYVDGKLFITSGYGTGSVMLDLSGATARKVWQNKSIRGHFATPVYLNGNLYGVDGNTSNGRLRCLDWATGKTRWSTEDNGFENLIVAGGRIIAIDKRGAVRVAAAAPNGYREAARGEVLSGRAKNWTAPVLANGRLYCRNSSGDLVCLDLR